jgi:hypothetical protein
MLFETAAIVPRSAGSSVADCPSAGIPHQADLTGKEIGTVSSAYELHEER